MMITQRDKQLLYLLLIMAIAAIGLYFFLLPAMASYTAAVDAQRVAEQQYQRQQLSINSMDVTMQQIAAHEKTIATALRSYPQVMHNLELDRRNTQRMLLQQWKPVSLSMENVAMLELKPFGQVLLEEQQEVAQATLAAQLPGSVVSLEAKGTLEELIALLDYTFADRSLLVDSMEISYQDATVKVVDGTEIAVQTGYKQVLGIKLTLRQFYATATDGSAKTVEGLQFS